MYWLGNAVELSRYRKADQSGERLRGSGHVQEMGAYLVNQNLLAPWDRSSRETALSTATVDQAAAYRIVSASDSAYADPVSPTAVYIKAKPTGTANNQMSLTHQVYLKLPSALHEGTTYRIEFRGVNIGNHLLITSTTRVRCVVRRFT